jgi:hypothetical protein
MTDYDRFFIIFTFPIMVIISIYEIKRGLGILNHQKYSHPTGIRMRLLVYKYFGSKEAAENEDRRIMGDKKYQKRLAIYGIMFGIIMIIGYCVSLFLVLFY